MPAQRAVDSHVAAALEIWAKQKRRLFLADTPLPSIMGKIRDVRVAAFAGDAQRRQKWAEVYWSDGLVIQRILIVMPELPRLTVSFFYTLRPWHVSVADQVRELGITKHTYWDQLRIAEVCVGVALALMPGLPAKSLNGARV